MEMLEYASQDVLYLPLAYHVLRKRLLFCDEKNKIELINVGSHS